MNFSIKNIACKIQGLFYVPVRTRYYAERIAQGPRPMGYGYKDKVSRRGILPRLADKDPLPMKEYEPNNAWTKKKALFGQNDYIDILGDGKLNPIKIMYDVPKYLRGINGNEMQLLTRKLAYLSKTNYPNTYPKKWEQMGKRLQKLYVFLNRKTKTGVSNRS